jgi:hypothetical protein
MRQNPYPGVNAHLNSLLQIPGTPEQPSMFPGFHLAMIAHLVDLLNELLPERYIAIAEQSLQSRGLDVTIESERPKPDVTIFSQSSSSLVRSASSSIAPYWEAPLLQVVEPVQQPRAVMVREVSPQRTLGKVVARVELLSPSNKPGGSGADGYAARRQEAIDTSIPLIEIDFLHESPSVVAKLPGYPSNPRSYPYTVLVTDPRPIWSQGSLRAYGFRVGEPIHPFPLPLAGTDELPIDLNPVYARTFHGGRWGTFLDYSTEPERMHTYRIDDQVFIRDMMAKVASSG